ncbi:unnamed protein product [Menidia menidia]|uniref:(Atlantic silverside) hypothetical protein n=1 Tax=Menidia menidia TaxID=238744 RepID=A0A8S4BDW2_9TELE|nr:unnamed protein product [Menidia menidia]
MSKSLKKKNHWTNKVHEAVIARGKEGELGFELKGGAENGQFPYFGEVRQGKGLIQSGKLAQDELLLEVNDMPVAGLTTRDVQAVVKHCKDPVRFKCVKQGRGLIRGRSRSVAQACPWSVYYAQPWRGSFHRQQHEQQEPTIGSPEPVCLPPCLGATAGPEGVCPAATAPRCPPHSGAGQGWSHRTGPGPVGPRGIRLRTMPAGLWLSNLRVHGLRLITEPELLTEWYGLLMC